MIAWFAASIAALSLGHYIKVLRWKMFVEIYEKPHESNLIVSLAVGYFANFCLPFKVFGDLIRAVVSGKKMKNGVSFSLTTVVIDRMLDFIAVYFLFIGLFFSSSSDDDYRKFVVFYSITIGVFLLGFFVLIKANKLLKTVIAKLCHIFNMNTELKGLLFFWALISSLKVLVKKTNKLKLVFYTMSIWLFYLASYYTFAKFLTLIYQSTYTLNEVVLSLFAQGDLIIPTLFQSQGVWFALVSFISLMILIIPAVIIRNVKSNDASIAGNISLLPHVSNKQRLDFLKVYFSGDDPSYIKNFMALNKNVTVIRDYSSGSNATTLLCDGINGTVFRKYAFGDAGEKLYDQILWLKKYKSVLPITDVVFEAKKDDYFCYEMPYIPSAMSLFEYVHNTSTDRGWKTLEDVLASVKQKLHSPCTDATQQIINDYVNEKIIANIGKIESADVLSRLMSYDKIEINGCAYNNLSYYKRSILSPQTLMGIFGSDTLSAVHGDLTMENIIAMQESFQSETASWYIIDPNTANLLDTPCLDYAKLLQSLHGGYEFLMRTDKVYVDANRINFEDTYSLTYKKLYEEYIKWLKSNFDYSVIKSIFYHEIVHWLRLMPYKINNDTERAVLFYAGMLRVMNDVEKMFGEGANNEG